MGGEDKGVVFQAARRYYVLELLQTNCVREFRRPIIICLELRRCVLETLTTLNFRLGGPDRRWNGVFVMTSKTKHP